MGGESGMGKRRGAASGSERQEVGRAEGYAPDIAVVKLDTLKASSSPLLL